MRAFFADSSYSDGKFSIRLVQKRGGACKRLWCTPTVSGHEQTTKVTAAILNIVTHTSAFDDADPQVEFDKVEKLIEKEFSEMLTTYGLS